MLRKPQLAEFLASDPRSVPAYSIPEAAHYLNIPPATLRSWVLGRSYRSAGGKKWFKSVITLPSRGVNLLSFFNLSEAHALRVFRTRHGIELQAIRKALGFVSKRFGWERPLIEQQFKTDGIGLFFEHLGTLTDASSEGQLMLREVMEAHLERLEWEQDVVARLYPFTRAGADEGPKSVMIDPRYSFGRPILRQSHVPTAIVAERYKAGDSIEHLAQDYGCSQLEIEEGVRCELKLQTAA
jgi:uncharacterized protein (DUF433 family)